MFFGVKFPEKSWILKKSWKISSVVFEKINNFVFFSKVFFLIGRNCLPEAKLGEYIVHIIDNPSKKIKNFKGSLFEKNHFQNFQKNRRHFLNF